MQLVQLLVHGEINLILGSDIGRKSRSLRTGKNRTEATRRKALSLALFAGGGREPATEEEGSRLCLLEKSRSTGCF
ncbi:hypothetical protein KFK09_004450 [Dendrobium nobile]|uniref:Uncharacterized protein n=1 Tax=Dendrobium nobile TaxID=94219 RepID=A0A8T3C454_DENNO|nr:hypothetical protein KFK09_004450 [Dendrobium nobile]